MATRLARCLGPVPRLQPKEWTSETASGRPAVACWDCSAIDELTEDVPRGGRVPHPWTCHRCGAVDFLELESFDEAVLT